MSAGLTAKRERFVREYLVDLNATQAAIRAGYSPKTANEQGARLLANVSIRDAITRGQQDRAERLQVTADKVLRDLEAARVAALAAGHYGAAIRASELQGRHLGLFMDRCQHEGAVGGATPLVIVRRVLVE